MRDVKATGQGLENFIATLQDALEYLRTQIADPLFRTKIGKIFHLAEIREAMAYESKPGAKAALLMKGES